jgi:hypothetical protein
MVPSLKIARLQAAILKKTPRIATKKSLKREGRVRDGRRWERYQSLVRDEPKRGRSLPTAPRAISTARLIQDWSVTHSPSSKLRARSSRSIGSTVSTRANLSERWLFACTPRPSAKGARTVTVASSIYRWRMIRGSRIRQCIGLRIGA